MTHDYVVTKNEGRVTVYRSNDTLMLDVVGSDNIVHRNHLTPNQARELACLLMATADEITPEDSL